MYKSVYKVILKEPIIVSSKDKTETALNCLDYIPGNIFLGMVAGKLYNMKNPTETLDIFHNGTVSFGNAYIAINDKQAKPVPSVWYAYKGKKLDEGIKLYHKLEDEDWKKFAEDGTQIEQQRSGYFLKDSEKITIVSPKKGVVLKSAYNSERRSAKKEQMYLYEYLEARQEFIFEIISTNIKYLEEINNHLAGNKYISRSKTAEFGAIFIENISENKELNTEKIANKDTYAIYAQSNLSFINKFGEFTRTPTADDLGFNGGKIDYEKSQVWFDLLHTRNGKRKNYDADRLIIKKGSIFIVEGGTPNIDYINRGIGVFLSEGYGKILINPDFLNEEIKEYSFEYFEPANNNVEIEEDDNLNILLKERFEKETQQKKMYDDVKKFIENINANKIKPSQWRAIRALIYQARASENNTNKELYKLIFDETKGYINHGRMAVKWQFLKENLKDFTGVKEKKRDGKIVKFDAISNENIEKLLLLTIEAAKKH